MHRTLAARLLEFYRESGLTYDEVSERSGLSKSTVHRLITKPPETPRPDTMERLAVALGYSMEELYEGLDSLPTTQTDYEIEILRAAVSQKDAELAAERKLQQSLADQLAKSETVRKGALEIFNAESRKNDQMLRDKDVVIADHKQIIDELRSTREYERKQKHMNFIALLISVSINIAALGSMVLYAIRAMK